MSETKGTKALLERVALAFYLSTLLILTVGCAKKEQGFEISPELTQYHAQFMKDAAARGVAIYPDDLSATLSDDVAGNVSGQCSKVVDHDFFGKEYLVGRQIKINRSWYDRVNNPMQSWQIQMVYAHEMAHCYLDMSHDDHTVDVQIGAQYFVNQPATLMNSKIAIRMTPNVWAYGKDAYMDQLLLRKPISESVLRIQSKLQEQSASELNEQLPPQIDFDVEIIHIESGAGDQKK
jgi:hypothetical protein